MNCEMVMLLYCKGLTFVIKKNQNEYTGKIQSGSPID